jgi:uncharacterized protein YbdZ (MbtH family)
MDEIQQVNTTVMHDSDEEDTTIYKVVVNHEEQYSIWPEYRENPLGWNNAGKSGLKAECLAYIKEVWTDMRPLSLRKQMEEAAQQQAQVRETPHTSATSSSEGPVVDLVERLSTGSHPVEACLRPERSVQGLKDCIDRGYVHIKFTNTEGGTELGVRLDRDALDLSLADFDNQSGSVHMVGGLTLNYVKVRCIADIELSTLSGQGHLEKVEA